MFADTNHHRHSQDERILIGCKFDRDIDIATLQQYRKIFASLQPTYLGWS